MALGHALAGAKRSLLLDDGDSVLLPLMLQSAQRGDAIEWGMSPVLFVFPELPLYLVSAALTTTVAASLLLNAVLNVVVLYGLLRFVAAEVLARTTAERVRHDPAALKFSGIAAALAGVAVFAVACLLETRPGGNTGEIASLYLTTTYYSGTVMALVASVGLVLRVDRSTSGRRIPVSAIVLALAAALATFSNPLYVLWATGPLVAQST